MNALILALSLVRGSGVIGTQTLLTINGEAMTLDGDAITIRL
jgi:hypothetical protein